MPLDEAAVLAEAMLRSADSRGLSVGHPPSRGGHQSSRLQGDAKKTAKLSDLWELTDTH